MALSLVAYEASSESEEEEAEVGTGKSNKKCKTEPVNSYDEARSDYFSLEAEDDEFDVIDTLERNYFDVLIEAHELSDPQTYPQPEAEQVGSSSRTYHTRKRRYAPTHFGNVAKTSDQNSSQMARTLPKEMREELTICHPMIASSLSRESSKCPIPKHLQKSLIGHKGCVNTLDWGPPQLSHLLLSASMDGSIKVWNIFAAHEVYSQNLHQAAARCARWSSQSNIIGSGGYDRALKLTDIVKDAVIQWYEHDNFVNCCIFHPVNNHLVLSGSTNSIQCWDIRASSDKPVMLYQCDMNDVQDIVFINEGNEFLCSTNYVTRNSANRTIMAWDFRTSAVLSNQIFHERFHCTRLRVHPSGHSFVAQTNGDYIALFSTQRPYKMNKNKRYGNHKVGGYWIGCDFTLDGHTLLSGSAVGQLLAYNFKSGNLVHAIPVAEKNTPCMAVESHPVLRNTVAVSLWDGRIQLLNA